MLLAGAAFAGEVGAAAIGAGFAAQFPGSFRVVVGRVVVGVVGISVRTEPVRP